MHLLVGSAHGVFLVVVVEEECLEVLLNGSLSVSLREIVLVEVEALDLCSE